MLYVITILCVPFNLDLVDIISRLVHQHYIVVNVGVVFVAVYDI